MNSDKTFLTTVIGGLRIRVEPFSVVLDDGTYIFTGGDIEVSPFDDGYIAVSTIDGSLSVETEYGLPDTVYLDRVKAGVDRVEISQRMANSPFPYDPQTQAVSWHIETPSDKTYKVVSYVDLNGKLKSVENAMTSAGTLSYTVTINEVNVTGLVNVAVTDSAASTDATALNNVSIGDKVNVVVSSTVSAEDFSFALVFE